jgi:hypothetical protein
MAVCHHVIGEILSMARLTVTMPTDTGDHGTICTLLDGWPNSPFKIL